MDSDQTIKENAPAEPVDEATRAKIRAALDNVAAIQDQIEAVNTKAEPEVEATVNPTGNKVTLSPYNLGIRAAATGETEEWTEFQLPPSRYLLAMKLAILVPEQPNTLIWCDDVPVGTNGCCKEQPCTVKEMFDLYTAAPAPLLTADVEGELQKAVLKLFQNTGILSVAVTLCSFNPEGKIQSLSCGYRNPVLCHEEVADVTSEIMAKSVTALAEQMNKKANGGLILPKNQGQIILPGQ